MNGLPALATLAIVATGVVDLVVRVSIVAVVAWAASRLCKREHAEVRYRIWATAVVFVLALVILFAASTVGAIAASVPRNARLLLPPLAGSQAPLLSLLGVLAAFALVRLTLVLRRVARLVRLPAALSPFVAAPRTESALASLLGDANIRILADPDDCVPSCWGLVQPTIVLPASANRWTSRQLEMVVLHEREHLRRRDPLLELLADLIGALLWFHPAVGMIARHLSTERELACDRAVVRHGIDPDSYAETLVDLARRYRPIHATALGIVGTSQLAERVEALLAEDVLDAAVVPASRMFASLLVTAAVSASLFLTPPVIGIAAGNHWSSSSFDEPAGATPASFRPHPEPRH